MKTRKIITETALKLFNSKGSYSVTTRHIAAVMNISPGNLYYHFKNKEDIIRSIFHSMIEELNPVYKWETDNGDILLLFQKIFKITSQIMYRYRFFFLELPMLLEKDRILKKKYLNIKQDRFSDFRKNMNLIMKAGYTSQIFNEEDFIIILENIWSLEESLLQSLYTNRIDITEKNIYAANIRILHIMKPYIKKEIWEKLNTE